MVSTLAPSGDLAAVQTAADNIGHVPETEFTNWQAAFEAGDAMTGPGDLVVIVTDGNPTASDSITPGSDNAAALADAITAAKAIKAQGTRIVAVGIDSSGPSGGLTTANLIAISGPNVTDTIDVDTDVILRRSFTQSER